jgi:poly(3-hydroxybutyrate) depolymerase
MQSSNADLPFARWLTRDDARRWIGGLTLVIACAAPAFAQKITKESGEYLGKKRAYYLFVPEHASAEKPVPLLVALHGSNHNGLSIAEKWKDLAAKEGFILVAPDSINSASWNTPADGPDFLHELISDLKTKYPIDMHRVYVYGHSGGAVFALYMGLFESEYYAAVAIHAGALRPDDGMIVKQTTRKIPIYIAVGTVDPFFPLNAVRATRDMLTTNGFAVQLIEMKGHDHWYYDLAPKINAEAWAFLKNHKLEQEPRYIQYSFK